MVSPTLNWPFRKTQYRLPQKLALEVSYGGFREMGLVSRSKWHRTGYIHGMYQLALDVAWTKCSTAMALGVICVCMHMRVREKDTFFSSKCLK